MKVHLMYAGDWIVVYLNGKMVYENHTISALDLLEMIAEETDAIEVDTSWGPDHGFLETYGPGAPDILPEELR